MNRILSIGLFVAALVGCSPQDSREINKAIVRNYIDILDHKDKTALWEIYFPETVRLNGTVMTRQSLRRLADTMFSQYPPPPRSST